MREQDSTGLKESLAPAVFTPDAEHFQSMFEDGPLAIAFVDERFVFLKVNAACQRLLGYSADELTRMTFADVTHPDDIAANIEHVRQLRSGVLKVYRADKRYITKDRSIRWASVTVSAVRGEAGEFRHFLTMIYDQTERRLAEQALRESEAFLRESQHIARIGSYDYDLCRNVWTSTAALDELFGIGAGFPHDFEAWMSLVHPDDREGMVRYASGDVFGRGIPFDREYRIVRPSDQRVRWVHGRGKLFTDGANVVTRMIGTIQDVTERRLAEVALRESEEKYRFLVDHLSVGVFRSTLRGRFLHVNRKVAEMAGYESVESLLALPAAQFYADPAERDRLFESLRLNGAVHQRELVGLRRDGTTYPVSVTAVLLRDAGGQPESLLGMVEDVTERKKTEAAQQRAERLESLGVLAGGIAHDFNNLLGGVFGFLELALQSTTEEPVREQLTSALRVFMRAKSLTQQLLTFAKGGTPNRQPTPLAPILRQSAQFALSGSQVAVQFDLPPDLPDCDIDENQIAQVLDNLAINAQQAMPMGGRLAIRARVVRFEPGERASVPAGDYVRVDVQDSGIGIPAEILPHIFDPFFTTKQKGSGLGLTTAHAIMAAHGGFIDVESAPGEGTTFRLLLPAAKGRAAAATGGGNTRYHGQGTILVMDDDADIRKILSRMLESMGHTALAAADGAEAVAMFVHERAAGRTLSAAILDLTVPGGMGGKEAVELLHRIDPALPVFASSGYSSDAVMARPCSFGFVDSLGKPMRKAQLADMLARHLSVRA